MKGTSFVSQVFYPGVPEIGIEGGQACLVVHRWVPCLRFHNHKALHSELTFQEKILGML